MGNERHHPYVLGIDLGVNSCGWAMLGLDAAGKKPTCILRTGVRVFEAGVTGDVQSGRDASRAAERREARLRRRQTARRGRRLAKVFHVLQRAGLLPEGVSSTGETRDAIIKKLDDEIAARRGLKKDPRLAHLLPYVLRATALDEKLEPHELGRALYHLGQRRGFLSNRKAPIKEDEELGVVKGAISELAQKMEAGGARTLGEYFSRLNPEEERIRKRYTSRSMYADEFEKIWAAQAEHHRQRLTAELKKELERAIFFQRPLKSQKGLIGECELEPGRKRAPMALLTAQRFRMLQKVNDLEITHGKTGEVYRLTDDGREGERATLIDALETQGDLTFPKIRKLLGLPSRPRKTEFNLERGGEKRLPGNRTAARLREVFGAERWDGLTDNERDGIVDEMRCIQKDDVLAIRAMKAWGLAEDAARRLAGIRLEDDYCSLSKRALRKLLPPLEKGVSYATARKKLYPERFEAAEVSDLLPPLDRTRAGTQLRNPAVARAVTELRKVVNAIIREHGKPDIIRLELARDLKRPRKQREEVSKRNRANQNAREDAAHRIAEEARQWVKGPSRADVEKVLLAEECGWICPYTGKPISMRALFGPSPQFDTEHIIPFSRSLDNSFVNKTLCDNDENRNRKRNRTPHEAYSSDQDKWQEITGRVKRFKSSAAGVKLWRFTLDKAGLERQFEGFSSRQLNDTRYASRLATEYLALLYGGKTDGTDRLRVQVGAGQVTSLLRSEWGLNSILGAGEKTREDHRHHAVDAVAIALTGPGTVKMLSDAARRARREHRRRFGSIKSPWPDFADGVRESIENITVSHRVSRKVSGALHEETIYSRPIKDENGRECYHARKMLDGGFSAKDVDNIVDPAVRRRVRDHLKKHANDPKKAFSDPNDMPYMVSRKGKKIPIKKARICKAVKPAKVGQGKAVRQAKLGNNHHVEVVQTGRGKAGVRWEGRVVPMLEAYRRRRAEEPIVRLRHEDGAEFIFSLSKKDCVQIDEPDGSRGLYVIDKITPGIITLAALNDARQKADAERFGRSADKLRQVSCRKVAIDPLGNVRYAND